MANVIQQLRVVLGLETKGFPTVRQQIKGFTEGAQRDLTGLKNQLAGFFTATAAVALAKSVSSMAGRWKDVSEQAGIGTDEVQRFDAAMKSVGGTVEDLIGAFDMLADKRKDALENGGKSAELFRGFGMTEDELRSTPRGSDLFRRMARSANDPTNPEARQQFIDAFGVKKAGKLMAGAAALEEGSPVAIANEEHIRILDESSKAIERGFATFKVAAVPFVAGLEKFAGNLLGAAGKALQGGSQTNPRSGRLARLIEYYTGVAPARPTNESGPKPTPPPPSTAPEYSADRAKKQKIEQEASLRFEDALNTTLFKAANEDRKIEMLRAAIKRDSERALLERENDNVEEASKLEAGVVKKAGDLAEIMTGAKPSQLSPDSLAQVGIFTGGATSVANIDPSLSVQQSQLDVLKQMLDRLDTLPPNMRSAIKEAFVKNPIDALNR